MLRSEIKALSSNTLGQYCKTRNAVKLSQLCTTKVGRMDGNVLKSKYTILRTTVTSYFILNTCSTTTRLCKNVVRLKEKELR